jgi:glycosyltransferase involved in cell wall biosynthesis
MRVDLVGVGGRAGCDHRPSSREQHPAVSLAGALRRLVPGSTVALHLWSEPPPELFAWRTPELATACALSTPLVEQLQGEWRRDRPDVVHADCWISGLAALRAARPLEIPVVAARWAGALDPWRAAPVPGDDVDLRLCLSADLVVARDEEDLARLHRHGVAKQVGLLPVGIAPAYLVGRDVEPGVAGVPMAGRLASILDASTLSSLRALLDAVDPRWGHREVVLLAPCGTPVSLAPTAYLRSPAVSRLLSPLLPSIERAAERGVRVTVEPGRDPGRRLELLRSAGVFVYTPSEAPSDRAVVEAMASGCLVVSSGAGRLAGLVEDGVTGLVTDGTGREELASALAAGSHADVARTLGRRAAAVVAEHYAWPAVATRARHLYKTVLGGG